MQINTMTEACDQMLSASDVGVVAARRAAMEHARRRCTSLRQLLAQEIEYMSSKECA